jgi:ubiquinone/menaquinone biosynthesis C-methylase UbiE
MQVAQTVRTPAEIYDDMFVPALFGRWGPVLCKVARVQRGDRVLDVACGTGALALAALARVGPEGKVAGLDASADMLSVARRNSASIAWHEGRAEALPFADQEFTAVASQFGIMFFENRVQALREMMRVLRPGGRLAIAVWDALDKCPAYAAFAGLLERLLGTRIAEAFRTPFTLGDTASLQGICREASIPETEILRRNGTVRFPSIAALVTAELAFISTLGTMLDDKQIARLREEAEVTLKPFKIANGAIAFELSALIISTGKQ